MSTTQRDDEPTTVGGADADDDLHVDGELLPPQLGDRFAVRRLLGTGAHGAVWEVFDHVHGRVLALKSLLRVDPEELVRFKREFRIVGGVVHPNLVTLHELFVEAGQAWLTMELVDGIDFLSWVRDDDQPGGGVDELRLRDALLQLVRALVALHAHGILHRDLKPSNVLVRADGQVRVADFGLAREFASDDDSGVAGTPAYMSPEQAANLDLTAASDWYGVGVMLYEALTGVRPHRGLRGVELLMAKQVGHPGPPSAVCTVPADLDRLCEALLSRDAAARPTGAEVLDRLDRPTRIAADARALPSARPDVFVGREHELATLERALRRVRQTASATVVVIEGDSGTGKSALLRRFTADVAGPDAVVLSGRCYERESVAYNGLDELIDGLREHLLSRGGVTPFVGAGALGRLFPVLADVPGIADAPTPRVEDPLELRRQAIDGLRELLLRVATARTLVLALDDLQWCDDDTAAMLLELLRPRHRPPALVVACIRSDATQPGAMLSLVTGLQSMAQVLGLAQIQLGPMSPEDATAVALAMLPASFERERLARSIAQECQGSPLFVAELVRHSAWPREGAPRPQLDAVIRARATTLPAPARRVLETLAVAARPLAPPLLLAAADAHEQGLETLALLRSQGFVRSRGLPRSDRSLPGDGSRRSAALVRGDARAADGSREPAGSEPGEREEPLLECYHDRIVAGIRGMMTDATARARHAALALQLERCAADPEDIAFHLEAAGEPARACVHLRRAAALADATLAFHRATRLYRRALALLSTDDPARHGVERALADTLARDGRGTEAAAAYVTAAASAPPQDVPELRRAAAEQLLRSGRLDDGLVLLGELLTTIGVAMPRGPKRALAALVAARTQLRLRGLEFEERAEPRVDREQLLRIDATWAAATGLLQSSVLLGQYFQSRHLLLALQGGEPRRVARALGLETLYVGTSGTAAGAHYDALRERVEGLCRRVGDPQAQGVVGMATGVAEVYRGRFAAGRDRLSEAETILRERCVNVHWELGMVHTFLATSLFYTGELARLRQVVEHAVRDADERDDLHALLMLRIANETMVRLADDRVDEGLVEIERLAQHWAVSLSTATYAFVVALARSRLLRYAGDGVAALVAIDERWRAIERSFMLTKQPLRIFMLHDRGCAALAAAQACTGKARSDALERARADARRLWDESTRWARAMALPLFASLHAADGEPARALQTTTQAERAFVEQGMPLHAASALRRRGELEGGALGVDIIATADAALAGHGVARPVAFARHLLPPVVGW